MQKQRPKLLRSLSYSLVVFCLFSCFPKLPDIQLPAPLSIPTSVPVELRIGKVQTDGEWIKITPVQASNLAAQIKYYQNLVQESYDLGRKEGQIVLSATMLAAEQYHKNNQKIFAYSIMGSLVLGFGLGALVIKGNTDVK